MWGLTFLMLTLVLERVSILFSLSKENCEKYVKSEDVVGVEEVKSSDKKLNEDEYGASDDEEIIGKIDI
ncbi:hypothetical protein V6Z12_A09G136800 [Gossypium hirsutum]